jgi:hypothetical protein
MAGVVVPTLGLLLVVAIFAVARYAMDVDLAIERALVFPLAAVPNLWGLWNVLYLGRVRRTGISIGVHGALLPLILVPSGVVAMRAFSALEVETASVVAVTPLVMAAYYLLWKHVVGFLNVELQIE